MCEVKDGGDAGETSIQEDDALEKIFSACDVPSTGRVSVVKLIGYMRDHMSTRGSPEVLKDLRTSMCAASYNGEVTRKQYHDVSRRWLIKLRKHQNQQDGNNNLHVDRNSDSLNDGTAELTDPDGATRIGTTLGLTVPVVDGSVGAADSRHEAGAGCFRGCLDLSTSTVVDDVGISCETVDPYFGNLSSVDGTYHIAVDDPGNAESAHDLRLRAHRCARANEHLREELLRAEDSIATLERQLTTNGRKLESVNIKCERLQREHEEHEEHKELLAAAERDREVLGARNQRLERDNSLLRKEIAAADTEMRRLNADLDRVSEQKEEWIRLLADCQKELIERQAMYDEVKGQVLKMESANDKLIEEHAISTGATEHLKVVVKELETRIAEMQLDQNYILRGGGVFASPDDDDGPDGDEAKTLLDVDQMLPRSLHDEMIATGYNEPEVCWGDNFGNLMETTEEEQRIISRECVETMRLATEELERATAEIAASHKELGLGLPPARSPPDAAEPPSRVQVHSIEKSGEYYASTGYLQRFQSQIRHVLTILSLVASHKVTNAETKDAATQLGGQDLVPELREACDINEFSPRNEYRAFHESEGKVTTAESALGFPSARASSSLVPPLDVSSLSSGLTLQHSPYLATAQLLTTSPPRILLPTASIIVSIVAALDEIIQETGTNAIRGSEADATRSHIGSCRDPNSRNIYTLASRSGPSGFETKIPSGAESPISMDAPSVSQNQMRIDVLGSESEFGNSYGWRRRESTTTDYTSDDTYGVGSNKSHSTFSEESNSRSPVLESLTDNPDSPISTETGGFDRMDGTKRIEAGPGTRDVEPTLAPVENQTFPDHSDRAADDLEDLNSVLERLTLRTALSSGEKRAGHTNYRGQCTAMADTRGDPWEQPHDKLPIRKTSVFHHPSDFCSSLEVGHKNGASIDHVSTVPVRASVPDFIAKTCDSLAGVSPAGLGDIIESPGIRGASQAQEGGSPHPTIKHGIESAKIIEYPCEDSSEPSSDLGTVATMDIRFGRVLADSEQRTWPSTMEPIKSEASPGDRRTKYVIWDTLNPPHPTTAATRCLPSNHEILDDAASAHSVDWRNDECGMLTGSRSVARAMSSEEDSSDSECTRDHIEREEHAQVALPPLPPALPPSALPPPISLPLSQTQTQTQTCPSPTSPPQRQPSTIGLRSAFAFGNSLACHRETSNERITPAETEQDCVQRRSKNHHKFGRSLSESDTGSCHARAECGSRCKCSRGWIGSRFKIPRTESDTAEVDAAEETTDQRKLRVFPNLPDTLLVELGLAVPSDGPCERIGEDALERKYTALAIGLETDRATLPQRLSLSLRQRDQAERNLATEVERMQRDIQALAPLCVDRESVERVERVRHQLEMISRCTLRVSCTAELLGATYQERRVSRVALLADRYLQAMRARCDKILADLAETKRILTENNIVVEENPNELGDDIVPRSRYRGVPPTNRTTISRRRASIATISRPVLVNSQQEATIKDSSRQHRASVPGRMTLRRPSLGYDTQRWDAEKLDRTDSSSSIGELREVFEQAESRRGSREENNNLIRSQSNNFSAESWESGDSDVWASPREDLVSCQAEPRYKELPPANTLSSRRTPRIFSAIQEHISHLPISWYILFVAVFFFGFYSNRYVATRSAAPFKWWSIDEIMKRYIRVRRNVPPPI